MGMDEEKLGFHKGALSVLAKEREELRKMLNYVEQLMQMHADALVDMGVDLEELTKKERKLEEVIA